MTDSLLFFLLMTWPAIIFLAWLVLLKRPEKAEPQAKELLIPPPFVKGILEKELIKIMTNEDPRPTPASKHDDILDSFDYEELLEASENMHRYTVDWERMEQEQRRNANSEKWLNEALDNAGEDYL